MHTFASDLPVLLTWYAVLFVLGLLAYPITARIFSSFRDKSYPFAKIIGTLFPAFVVWYGASLGIITFSKPSVLGAVILFAALNLYLARSSLISYIRLIPKETVPDLKRFIPSFNLMVFEEILFLILYLFWAYIRANEPSIRGLEKFMDFGFMQAILNSPTFPPKDMWLTPGDTLRYTQGFSINYYYFGHYVSAFLMRLSGIKESIMYNLILATLFAGSFVASFSIVLNLAVKKFPKLNPSTFVGTGLLGGFLVTLAGNLHTLYVYTSGYPNEQPVPFWTIFKLSMNLNYWYPNATRFIPNTIHEFPSYSWVVADLHGHVLDIPYVLLTIAVLVVLISRLQISGFKSPTKSKQKPIGLGNFKSIRAVVSEHWILILLGFLSAVMYMTNAWDGLIYLVVTGGVLVIAYLKKTQTPQWAKPTFKTHIVLPLCFVVGTFLITSIPFQLSFKPFVHGIGIVGGWEIARSFNLIPQTAEDVVKIGPFLLEKGKNERSPLWMLAVLWGFFYFFALSFLIPFFGRKQKQRAGKQTRRSFLQWSKQWFSELLLWITTSDPIDLLMVLFIGISTLLLIFPEFFYVKDIYPGHYRANTMFKLGYQVFIMLSIVSAYIFITTLETIHIFKRKLVRRLWKYVAIALIVQVGIYPYFSIQAYYGVFDKNTRSYDGIDGNLWMKLDFPGDYDAVQFLNSVKGADDVVLEAVGESYTDYARISAMTGIPTILGWPVHEWLWRGSYDEPGRRVEEVKQIYEGVDKKAVVQLLQEYKVTYIVIGKMERDKYPAINEKLLTSLGTEVFTSNGTRVYKVNSNYRISDSGGKSFKFKISNHK